MENYTSDVGWRHLRRLVGIHHDHGSRMAGSDGERAAAEETRDAFERYARDARLETFEIPRWERAGCTFRTPTGDANAFALPRAPSEEATGELFDAGYGMPDDFDDADGCVVVASSDTPPDSDRFVHRREKYYRAVDAGARAFVFRNHIDGCLAPTGSVGGRDGPYGPIPAVGVSKEVGARTVRRHEGDEVTVGVEARTDGTAESTNIHAELGPGTDEKILVTSHVDAHDISEGAVDNAAGVAVCLEVARILSDRDLGRRVVFVAYGAEEVGLLGSRRHAARADDVTAVVNIDGVGRSRDLAFYSHGFSTLAETARRAADEYDHRAEVLDALSPHSDHWSFVRDGTPGYHVKSARSRDRGWGHTAADTLDKLDARDLREAAVVVAETVELLTHAETEPKRRDEIDARLRAEGYEQGMRVTGDWSS